MRQLLLLLSQHHLNMLQLQLLLLLLRRQHRGHAWHRRAPQGCIAWAALLGLLLRLWQHATTAGPLCTYCCLRICHFSYVLIIAVIPVQPVQRLVLLLWTQHSSSTCRPPDPVR